MQQQGVRKTFKYQLMPTPEQERAMESVLWRCRALYNAGLEERKAAWEKCRVSVSFAMQSAQLPAIKEMRPDYREINAQVLQRLGQKAPGLEPGDERSAPFSGSARLCENAAVAPCQLHGVAGVAGSIGPLGKSTTVVDGAARDRDAPLGGALACLACQSPHTPLLTADGLALLVTVSVPPEQTRVWLGRWTGRLRRP